MTAPQGWVVRADRPSGQPLTDGDDMVEERPQSDDEPEERAGVRRRPRLRSARASSCGVSRPRHPARAEVLGARRSTSSAPRRAPRPPFGARPIYGRPPCAPAAAREVVPVCAVVASLRPGGASWDGILVRWPSRSARAVPSPVIAGADGRSASCRLVTDADDRRRGSPTSARADDCQTRDAQLDAAATPRRRGYV